MKKDENSGVSIKQIMVTTLFLVVTTFGGLNAYRIVCEKTEDTILDIESANLEESKFETALVENTEEDRFDSKNIKFLSAKIIDENKETNDRDNVVSRGNFIREQLVNDSNKPGILLNSVLNEIKELSEKQVETNQSIVPNTNEEMEVSSSEGVQPSTDKPVEPEKPVEATKPVEPAKPADHTEQATAPVVTAPTGVPTEYIKTIDVKATAYCLCKKCCGKSPSNPGYGVTASGLKITPGVGMKVVASDPKVIPLGTKVYVEGLYGANDYGYAVVADTGSAIKNLKIDLYMDTHQMALNWGVKTVRVYILGN